MKKILIASQCLEIGGAEKALIGLLNSIDKEAYQVDLFLCRQMGELMEAVPQEVTLLPKNKASCLAVPMIDLIKNRQFNMLYGRLKAKILAKRYVKQHHLKNDNQVELTYSHRYTYRYIETIQPDVTYDLAISFLTPHYITAEKVKAKKKIAWIHTDYSMIDIDEKTEREMWSKYDYIASISDQCTQSFVKRFPTLEDKIIRIDNILTEDMVWSQADETINEILTDSSAIKLLSIGRYSHAKNFDNVPDICKRIRENGLNVVWYLIGYGGDEALIKNKIAESHMEEYVKILGKKENPYPYIKACDFYIQPSRYEGKAVTVREAQILKKPVIITNYATSASQLRDGYDGIIVPMDNEGCAKGIADFIRNKTLQEKIISNLEKQDYSNADEVEKIYALME